MNSYCSTLCTDNMPRALRPLRKLSKHNSSCTMLYSQLGLHNVHNLCDISKVPSTISTAVNQIAKSQRDEKHEQRHYLR
jgi:hypothetical protein